LSYFLHITAYKYSWIFLTKLQICLTPKWICYIKITHCTFMIRKSRLYEIRVKHHSTQFQTNQNKRRKYQGFTSSVMTVTPIQFKCRFWRMKFCCNAKWSVQRRYQETTTILPRKKKEWDFLQSLSLFQVRKLIHFALAPGLHISFILLQTAYSYLTIFLAGFP